MSQPPRSKPSRPPPAGTFRRATSELFARRRSSLALLVALVFAMVAVFAELIAADLPIACKVHGKVYLAPNVTRPAELAGWDNGRVAREVTADGWAVYPLVRFGPERRSSSVLLPPLSDGHPLGTDSAGRDQLARLVHATRTSLTVAVLAVAAIVVLGSLLGALGGFYGRGIDFAVERGVDTLSAFPAIVMLVVVQAVQEQPTLGSLLVAIALTQWTEIAQLVRAQVRLVAARDYALAARALGATPLRVLWKHVLPNAKGPIVVAAALGIGQLVVLESALGFLGVGLPPETPSFGGMLAEVRGGAAWLAVAPGVAVMLLTLSFNVLGESLREGFDPRAQARAKAAG
jgi:peptide/nickel transport system permease protein